jgi:GxxExxY protein
MTGEDYETADDADDADSGHRKDFISPAMTDSQTYAIIGACFEVHKQLGWGFLEAVYQEALEREFALRGIPFRRQVDLFLYYKGAPLKSQYRADFICYEEIIVEIKAIKQLTDVDRAQTINYLKATRLRRAILSNFGCRSLQVERLVNNY